jgi:TRAP-type C4-dicarboxylate transport system permease small subunit
MFGKTGASLHRIAEATTAVLMAIIFVAFIIQIVFRYAFNLPVGWTSELSVICWLWLVLWGTAFVLKDQDEIRFDLVSASVGLRARIVIGIVASVAIVVLYAMSLPASFAYVSFMKVEKSSYLNVRFDWLFSIYIAFAIAVIVRNLWRLWQLLQGQDPRAEEPTQASSSP